jgi:hypothetical protein
VFNGSCSAAAARLSFALASEREKWWAAAAHNCTAGWRRMGAKSDSKAGGFLAPKAIANRIKAKGLTKLRWYAATNRRRFKACFTPCAAPF